MALAAIALNHQRILYTCNSCTLSSRAVSFTVRGSTLIVLLLPLHKHLLHKVDLFYVPPENQDGLKVWGTLKVHFILPTPSNYTFSKKPFLFPTGIFDILNTGSRDLEQQVMVIVAAPLKM